MISLSTEDFRASMGNCLDRFSLVGESFVITRNGTPFVKVSPVPPHADSDNIRKHKAIDIRTKTAALFGSVHILGEDLLIIRRSKPTALVTSLRKNLGENL